MTDIAKLTGVSQSTVSLVLNNATGAKFSETTRNKVLKAAHDLGYRLSPREPVLASKDERNLIVYLADEISTSPHPVVNIDGARDAAYASGKMLAVYSTHGNADIEQQVLETTLSNPHLFGVIYATVYTRKVSLPAALSRVPTGAAQLLHERRRPVVGGARRSGGRPYRHRVSCSTPATGASATSTASRGRTPRRTA